MVGVAKQHQFRDIHMQLNSHNQYVYVRRIPVYCDGLESNNGGKVWVFAGEDWQPIYDGNFPYRHYYISKHLRLVEGHVILCFKVLSYGSNTEFNMNEKVKINNDIPKVYLKDGKIALPTSFYQTRDTTPDS